MNAEEIIRFIHDAKKTTPVKAYVKAAGDVEFPGCRVFGAGDKVVFGAQSGVPSSTKGNQRLIGTPPMEEKPYFKSQAIFRKLPDMYFELNALRKELNELKEQLKK